MTERYGNSAPSAQPVDLREFHSPGGLRGASLIFVTACGTAIFLPPGPGRAAGRRCGALGPRVC